MIMKTSKFLTSVLSAFMLMGLGMGVASCSDSDNNENGADNLVSTLTLDEKVARFGVETDMESVVVPLNVACKGAWSVAVEKGKDWVSIENNQVFYQGSQTLQLLFDENRTEVDRTAILYITNDAEETQTVTLRQTALYNGEAPSNSNIQIFGGKGLGCGINVGQIFRDQTKAAPGKFNPLAIHKLNNVFNLGRIESLMENGKFSGEQPYIEEVLERGEASIVKWDSLVQKGRKLKATLNMEISFGFFNLQVGGEYNAVDTMNHVGLDYAITRNLALYNAYVQPSMLRSYAIKQDALDMMNAGDVEALYDKIDAQAAAYKKRNKRRFGKEELTADQKACIDAMYEQVDNLHTYGGVFSSGFANLYTKLSSAFRSKDQTKIDAVLEQIDSDYGPFIIARAVLGGSLNMNCWLSNAYLFTRGTLAVKTALEGEGMFKVNGTLDWSQNGLDAVRNSKRTYDIYGGNANQLLTDIETVMNSDNPRDGVKLDEAMSRWVSSLYGTQTGGKKYENSNAALITITLTGVWELFEDAQVQAAVKQFFIEKYKNYDLEKYVDMMYQVEPDK